VFTDAVLIAMSKSYKQHFGPAPIALTQTSRDAVDRHGWSCSKERLGKLGSVVISILEGAVHLLSALSTTVTYTHLQNSKLI